MKAHVQFLESGFQAGVFIAAGRQQPRVGGIILACACGRANLDALMAVDPFVESGAASYRMVEFRSSLHHADFKACSPTRVHVRLVRKVIDSLTTGR
ncbi:MAG: YciI family protein [Candidatus Latescibacterota bacterium]